MFFSVEAEGFVRRVDELLASHHGHLSTLNIPLFSLDTRPGVPQILSGITGGIQTEERRVYNDAPAPICSVPMRATSSAHTSLPHVVGLTVEL